MDEKFYDNLITVFFCIFAISIILNIGFIVGHIIINKDCECENQIVMEE